jgi:ketosteroid isomerase-like protein
VVLGFEKVRSKRTGRSFENHWAHSFTLADGKIIKFREYAKTAAVAAAFDK